MDEFDLILDSVSDIDEGDSLDLTGTIDNLDAPGSEVTIDVDWGDSTSDSVGIIDGGSEDTDGAEDGSIGFSIPHTYTDDGTFTIDVDAQEEIVAGTDAVFVIDTSGSTSSSSGIDVDGDGSTDSILEAEVAAFQALNQNLIDRGLGNSAQVSVVAFGSSERLLDLDPVADGVQTFTTPLADIDGDGVRDVDQALDTLNASGSTDFEDGLQGAIQAVNNAGTPPGEGSVIFLSDGFPNSTSGFDDEVSTINNNLGQGLRAFGVGSGSSLSALQQIDPNAVQFTDIQDLLNLFDGTGGSVNTDSESVDVVVNDVTAQDPAEIIFQPLNPIAGTPNDDNLIGTDQDDEISGGDGNDGITGGDGNDVLLGESGDDAIEGGEGTDFLDGGSGTDTAVYQFDPAGVTITLDDGGNFGSATDGYGDTDSLIEIENVIASESNDIITGNSGRNNLTGRGGDDEINGEGGNDFLTGSAGSDSLAGGAGSDSFVYLDASEGGDVITDFEVGSDTIAPVSVVFGGGLSSGELPGNRFTIGTSANTSNQRFIYDDTAGDLFFDADGNGSASQQLIATLDGIPSLSASDIQFL